jgi:hypothetical protein
MYMALEKTFILFVTLLLAARCAAQTSSGTLIMWEGSPDAVVIAADSRIVKRIDRPEPGDNDLQCKIIIPLPKVAFVVTGLVTNDSADGILRQELGGRWDAAEVGRRIVQDHFAKDHQPSLEAVAEDFGREYARAVNLIARRDPSQLAFLLPAPPTSLSPGETSPGSPGEAIFFGVDAESQITIIEITLTESLLTGLGRFNHRKETIHPHAVGEQIQVTGTGAHYAATFLYSSEPSALLLRKHRGHQQSTEDMIREITDLAFETVNHAPRDADFGGKIDIGVMDRLSGFRWIARKPNCHADFPELPQFIEPTVIHLPRL